MAIIKNSKEGSLVGYVSVKNERYKDFDFINNVALHGTYNLSLSYKDFMIAANKFPWAYGNDSTISDNMEESAIILTPEQKDIEKCNSFNVTALGDLIVKKPGEPSYTVTINNAYERYVIIESISLSTIKNVNSYAFFNVPLINIKFDVETYVKDYMKEHPDTESTSDLEAKAEFVKNGFKLPFTVADPNDIAYNILFDIAIYIDDIEEDKEDEYNNSQWILPSDDKQEVTLGYISDSYFLDYAFVNSISLRELNDYYVMHDNKPYSISGPCMIVVKVDERCSTPFEFSLVFNNDEILYQYSPSFSSLSAQSIDYERVTKMNGPDVSYALLRTNPKLTGNVKVVVDSNSNIYLDTFKVSTALSQKQYRHVKVASTDYYGENLMTRYKNIPSTDFYKVEDRCYTLFTPAQTYKDEYYDLYRMGAKTNTDEMYSENYSIFAPICLKEQYPDFFVVFKIDKDILDTNNGTRLYDEDNMSDVDKLKYFIKYGTVVKSYDMRPGSKLGSYIETIVKRNENAVGEIYESYDTGNYNKVIGISLDKGVVSSVYESVYPIEKLTNQVQLNDYYTNGFERNHLVSKNIINLEFMFDDPGAELFSIDTYFGFYIKVNTSGNDYSCIGMSDGVNVFDSSINTFSQDIRNIRENFEDSPIIYGITTPKEFIRLNTNIYTSKDVNKFMLLPYKNIYNSVVNKAPASSILTFTLHDLLTKGDHIRFIFNSTKEIYEIICSNTPWHSDENFVTGPIINYVKLGNIEYKVKRVSLYLGDLTRDSSNNVVDDYSAYDKNEVFETTDKTQKIKDTVTFIYNALLKLFESSNVSAYKIDDYNIAVKSFDEESYFERICSASGFDTTQREYIYTTEDENKTISVFNDIYLVKAILNLDELGWKSSKYVFLYPLNFELVGSRMAYICKFVSSSEYSYFAEIPDTKIFDTKTILYQADNDSYTLYEPYAITLFETKDTNLVPKTANCKYIPYIKSGYYMLNVNSPKLVNNVLCLYSSYPINDGICSIFNIKDFDFNVLDAKSKVLYNDNSTVIDTNTAIGISGEYAEKSIFNTIPVEDEDVEEQPVEDVYKCKYSYNELIADSAKFDEVYNDLFGENGKYKNIIQEYSLYDFDNAEDSEEKNEKVNQYFDQLVHVDIVIKVCYPGTSIENITDNDYNKIVSVYPWINTFNEYYNEDSERYGNDYSEISYYKIPQNQYILGNDNWSSSDVSTIIEGTFEENRQANCVFVDAERKYQDPQDSDKDPSFNMPSEYLASGVSIRNTDEENFKDYIDKNRIIKAAKFDKKEDINDSLLLYFKENHKNFDISLTSPHACKWKSIGTDARGKDYRLMYYDKDIELITEKKDMTNKSYYIVGPDSYASYIGYLYDSAYASSEETSSKYIGKSINAVVQNGTDKTGIYVKDAILTKNITIDDLLYNSINSNNKLSIAYINGDNCLEFISAGVKINIKSNNDNAINLNNYNGYSAAFIVMNSCNTNYNKETELIIDETRKQILLVWYIPANTFKYGISHDGNGTLDMLNAQTEYYISYLNNAPLFENIKTGYIKGIDGESYITSKYLDLNNLRNKKLCNNSGTIYISSVYPDKNSYTALNRLVYTGQISASKPIPSSMTSLDVYPYYIADNNITLFNSKFWHNDVNGTLSSSDIALYAHDYSAKVDYLLITDSPNCIINNVSTFETLSTALSNHAIFIKTDDGKKDYTNLQGILDITAVKPFIYKKDKLTANPTSIAYVHSTYAEPLMKDMVVFNYLNPLGTDVETAFKKIFTGGNICVSKVNPINQIWINKYTEINDYCGSNIDLRTNKELKPMLRTSADVIHNKSIMNSAWSKNEYRKYYLDTDDNGDKIETYENIDGYVTGYEKKHFLNSRGIQLKLFNNNTLASEQVFEVTSWKNTSISKAKKYIRLDISDSIVYKLINNEQYMKTWNYLKISSNNYKINYIKKTILPLININNKTRIVLKRNSTTSDTFNFVQDFDSTMITVDNYKNILKYENGKYYMYIYPEDNYTYCAKMIIDL